MLLNNSENLADKAGIWTSSLCALHCLLLPVLIPIVPLVGASFFAQGWFERTILSVSLIIGFGALLFGFFRYHRQLYPFFSLVLGGILYWNKDMFGETYEPVTVVVGALLIIAAHLLNLRLCNSCRNSNC